MMENWKYKIQISPQEAIKKLESVLISSRGFDFNVDDNSASFKIWKPVKYPDQILHRNRLIVNGKILNSNTNNESDVEISFAQDFYMKMTVFSIIIFGGILLGIISQASSGVVMYLYGGLVLILGTVLWKTLQKKLESDSRKYKELIAEILGSLHKNSHIIIKH